LKETHTSHLICIGTVSAFAFKAKQVPLQDLSNRKPPNGTAAQATNDYNGTNGHSTKKPKLAVAVLPPEVNALSLNQSASYINSSQLSNVQEPTQTLKDSQTLMKTSVDPVHTDNFDFDEVAVEQENRSDQHSYSLKTQPFDAFAAQTLALTPQDPFQVDSYRLSS